MNGNLLHAVCVLVSLVVPRPVFAASEPSNDFSSLPAFPFQQVAPGLFTLGQVTLNKSERTVSFPAIVNQRRGPVEYAVVTMTGKTHESVFRTDAQPQHIHMAMLLLGAQPANTNMFPANLSEPLPGERVTIDVTWRQKGRKMQKPIEDFIVTTNSRTSLSRGPWIYNGSFVVDGQFLAQVDGSIISVHIDPVALINNPREGRENDDLNHVNAAALPPDRLPLQITIHLQPRPFPR